MIQKANKQPINFSLLPSKYTIDQFHNPYLSKFIIKCQASTHKMSNDKKHQYQFLSPFLSTHKFYLSQSLPIYKNQKFRVSLLWKQFVNKAIGKGHFGISTEYKTQNNFKVKGKFLTGTTLLFQTQVNKSFENGIQIMTMYSGFYNNFFLSNTFGGGIKKHGTALTLFRRVGIDNVLTLSHTQKLPKQLEALIKTDITIDHIVQSKAEIGLSYLFSNKTRATAAITYDIDQKQVGLKFQAQKSVLNRGNFILDIEYKNNCSIFYFGYKNPTFNIILPFLIVDSPIPTIIAAISYIAGFFLKKKHHEIKTHTKQMSQRIDELKLISDKANINYQKQQAAGINGLLIEQAYVGPSHLLDKLQQSDERVFQILRSQEMRAQIFDVTVTMRFYVVKNQLKLIKGNKMRLLGFYCKNQDDEILIKYEKHGRITEERFKQKDSIWIK